MDRCVLGDAVYYRATCSLKCAPSAVRVVPVGAIPSGPVPLPHPGTSPRGIGAVLGRLPQPRRSWCSELCLCVSTSCCSSVLTSAQVCVWAAWLPLFLRLGKAFFKNTILKLMNFRQYQKKRSKTYSILVQIQPDLCKMPFLQK